ncbi:hypothetical protein AEYBE204_00885 [Asticcacaulis sp. YBE204]|nr:hypothetical protein AEYBE204_00885 [Asticcacaulis sp. YBE204]
MRITLALTLLGLCLSGCMEAKTDDLTGTFVYEDQGQKETLILKADGTATLQNGYKTEHFRWATGEAEPGCLRVNFEPVGNAEEWHPCADKGPAGVFISQRKNADAFYKKVRQK